MKIKLKKLDKTAIVPKYQTAGASGFDLHAIEDVTIYAGETKLVKSGISVAMPKGYELQVRPRSGLSLKSSLRIANSPGTVDSDFRGELGVVMTNTSLPEFEIIQVLDPSSPYKVLTKAKPIEQSNPVYIAKGDRIAQGVICSVYEAEFEEVEDLDATPRGQKGFGSTGSTGSSGYTFPGWE